MKLTMPSLPPSLDIPDDIHELFKTEDDITGVRIEGVTLTSNDLKNINIAESFFNKVDFEHSDIQRFDVLDSIFRGCNFTATKFPESSWRRVSIDAGRCIGMQLANSTLRDIDFKNSKLDMVNFRFSHLENVGFDGCTLNDVDFYDARLKNVEFVNCTINGITFASARMNNVDISKSTVEGIKGINSLRGVTISYDQLMQLAPSFAAEAGIKVK